MLARVFAHRARRLMLLAGTLGVFLSVGAVFIVFAILKAGWNAEAAGHQAVAEGLFEAIDTEIVALLRREEERSFLQYRNLLVPQNIVGEPGLVRSPLAEEPETSFIVGYFQEGDGFEITGIPRDNEVDLLGPATDEALCREEVLLPILEQWHSVSEQTRAEKSESISLLNSMKVRSPVVRKRSPRRSVQQSTKVVSTNSANVDGFLSEDVQKAINSEKWEDQPQLDARVSALFGERVGEDHAVVWRLILVGEQKRRQGFVINLPQLEEYLYSSVLGAPAEVSVHLGPAEQLDYQFSQPLPAPLDSVNSTICMSRIAVLSRLEPLVVVVLFVLLCVVVGLGGVALVYLARAEVALSQRRADFVAAVSHELKTPLTAIRMHTEMLELQMIPTEEKKQQAYGVLRRETERLSRLISNVLELGRLEKGTIVNSKTALVQPVLERAVQLVRPAVVERGASLVVELEAPNALARFEEDGLTQIIVNLIDNAVKFSKKAENREVVLSLHCVGTVTIVSVRDHGPGVPKGSLRKIFEPFYRGERELVRTTTGTGIGLALVFGLAHRMGAEVVARNHPQGGLEVLVKLSL